MSQPTVSRLLELLGLLQARTVWRGSELAQTLDVTTRTVRNDIARLRELGYPVEAQVGLGGGYRLGAGKDLPPLLLDDDEAVALAVSLRIAAGGSVANIEEPARRALSKLDQVLPTRLRRRVGGLGRSIASAGSGAPALDPDVLVAASNACRDHEGLRFAYRAHSGESTQRKVDPHSIVHLGRFWYLVGWDRDRDDWRTFRLDRLDGLPRSDRRFIPRSAPPGGFAAYVARGRFTVRDRWQAEIVLHGAYDELVQRVPPAYGGLEPLGANRCLLRTGADWLGALAVHVALLGVDFEVRSPPELIGEIEQLATRFARASKNTGH